ncbi:MAG: cyclic nucleotide-binding domain-containing protein [Deltaproteobacteria bacterium]|nr:cyclic nucleotide-binding domain-containing protein [Deltaproteobacteria bacterium]
MKKFYLAFQIGSMRKSVYPLLGPTTIGRGADNTITIPDPTISRNHAKLSFQKGYWAIEDMQSANGIMVNGSRVDRLTLKSGDTFHLGDILFSFIEREIAESENRFEDTVKILSSVEGLGILDEKEEPELSFERIREVVAAIPFVHPLNEMERRELADATELHGFSAEEIIMREGDPGRSIYVILNGRVRVFTRDYEGNEEELAILEKGQFFGEMSFLTGKSRSAYVSALDTSMLMELSFTSMRKLIRGNHKVRKILLDHYRDRQKTAKQKGDKIW